MSYEYHGKDMVALPGRTTQTFPSGLVRVEQMYAVKKNSKFSISQGSQIKVSQGIAAPSIERLYVFPAPEFVEEENGFTKYKVTAYGRGATSATAQGVGFYEPRITKGYAKLYYIQRNITIIDLLDGDGNIVGSDTITRDFKFDSVNSTYTRTQVVAEGESPNLTAPTDNAEVSGLSAANDNDFFSWELSGVSSVNYGYWTEYIINFQAAGLRINTSIGARFI
jgi:hypothetical protein